MTMKIVKVLSIALLTVAVSAGLTACMNDGGTTAPQQTTGFMPETTAAPNADMTATQPPVAFDWVTGSGTVEASVNRISEISDCRVVTAGTTALVGVKFTNAYQGDLTERIRQMVAAHDVGKAVNPLSIEGQIEGGVVMSMGFALTERYPLTDCRPTAKYGTLGLFRANQIPEITPIIVEKAGLNVACGAIGIGEITSIPTAPAIADAYYRYDGKFRTSLPLEGTPYSRK